MKQVISVVCGLFVLAGVAAYAFDAASAGNAYSSTTVTARGNVAGVTFPTAVASNANRRAVFVGRTQAASTNVTFGLATVASAALCSGGSNTINFAVGTVGAATNGAIQWPVKLRVEDIGVGALYFNAATGEVFTITEVSRSTGNNE